MSYREGEVRARRCTDCSIQYPPGAQKCPICGNERLWAIYKSGPDDDWYERVEASLGEKDAPKIAYTTPHRADQSAPLHLYEGLMWFTHLDLLDAGYLNMEPGTIVFINNRFYELQARSKRRGDMWWVEELVIDGCFDDATPEDIIGDRTVDG